jgi:hypothetical protein
VIDLLPHEVSSRIEVVRVDGCPVDGDCWVWMGSRSGGYGHLYTNGGMLG